MTDELKKLIEEAPHIHSGKFAIFMIVPNGQYDGFWGVNGYDNILILARPCNEDQWYILSTEADVFNIYHVVREDLPGLSFSLDIPTEYGVPRIWFNYPVEINYEIPTATIMGQFTKKDVN